MDVQTNDNVFGEKECDRSNGVLIKYLR